MTRAIDTSGIQNELIVADSPISIPPADSLTEKIQKLFASLPPFDEFVGDYIISPILAYMPSVAKAIGELVAYNLIYPTIPPAILKTEARFAEIDRDGSIPNTDPMKTRVSNDFKMSTQELTLDEEGLTATCLTFESIRGSKNLPSRHIVTFCGNLGTTELSQDYYAFARAWLELEEKNPELPPLKISIVSARNIYRNGLPYLPPLSVTGGIHKNIIDKLADAHGPIDQVVAFSLGCVVATKVMDSIEGDAIANYPKRWWLHNGPSSLEKVSKLYPMGRLLLWPAAIQTGWSANPALSLQKFCGRIKELGKTDQFSIGVSGLYGDTDHHFPYEVSLCNSSEVAQLKTAGQVNHLVQILLSQTEFHVRDHHGRALEDIELKHLVDPLTGDFLFHPLNPENDNPDRPTPFILPGEHLARSILRELVASSNLGKSDSRVTDLSR